MVGLRELSFVALLCFLFYGLQEKEGLKFSQKVFSHFSFLLIGLPLLIYLIGKRMDKKARITRKCPYDAAAWPNKFFFT